MADKIEGKQLQALTLPIGKHQLTMSMAAKLEQMQAGGAFSFHRSFQEDCHFFTALASIGADSHGSRLESAECAPCTFLVPATEFPPTSARKWQKRQPLSGWRSVSIDQSHLLGTGLPRFLELILVILLITLWFLASGPVGERS